MTTQIELEPVRDPGRPRRQAGEMRARLLKIWARLLEFLFRYPPGGAG
jgi:hypothetical protein